ncbi:hypothetical protein [Gluconobacter aidae]|nr:hypothetical protein [Gluconobacter aidae]
MREQTVTSGRSVSGSTVSSGDALIVSRSGNAISTTALDAWLG